MKYTTTLLLISIRVLIYGQTWTENSLKDYWKKNGADDIEGIYSREIRYFVHVDGLPQKIESEISEKKYYIVKNQDQYILNDFSGEFNGSLTPTYNGSKFIFKTNQKSDDGEVKIYGNINSYLLRTNSTELAIDNFKSYMDEWGGNNYMILMDRFTLLYKPENKPPSIESYGTIKSTGTGFAITSNGLIATNYHVIEGAKEIQVKGVKGDFSKFYKCTIVAVDKNNDLAIIKISDFSLTSLGTIPYIINQTSSDIGSPVNILGYPLTATMGEDIKYNNGTISSKSGFQGDITSYQISVPIQPGNSGGPLFDKRGNIIGIVNAKHLGAENVGYAVKSNYLLNLIETIPNTKLQTVNTIFNKTLSEQIKSIQNFVYLIEIN